MSDWIEITCLRCGHIFYDDGYNVASIKCINCGCKNMKNNDIYNVLIKEDDTMGNYL